MPFVIWASPGRFIVSDSGGIPYTLGSNGNLFQVSPTLSFLVDVTLNDLVAVFDAPNVGQISPDAGEGSALVCSIRSDPSGSQEQECSLDCQSFKDGVNRPAVWNCGGEWHAEDSDRCSRFTPYAIS